MTEPLHVLALMTATSPWVFTGERWGREFTDGDSRQVFILLGPTVARVSADRCPWPRFHLFRRGNR